MLGERVGHFVGRAEQERVECLADGDFVADAVTCAGRTALDIVNRVIGEGDSIIQFAALNDNEGSQDFCDARGIVALVNILSVEDSAGIGIHQNAAFRFNQDILRPGGLGKTLGRLQSRKANTTCKKQRECAGFDM